jgi:ectoine hydroxylase-related dioxygenase (phytanoyl-CoA dioxygenase family)
VKRQEVTPIIEEDPDVFYPLAQDDRLLGVVDGLLGEDSLYTGGNDGNLYVGNTRWHPDGGGLFAYDKVKTAFYCDRVVEGKGCLSVIPGSHHTDYCCALTAAFDQGVYDRNSPDVPGRTPLESSPGDVVAFHHGLWHSSWGGSNYRRMFTFNWCAYPRLGWQETWLRGHLRAINEHYGKKQITDRLIETAGPRLKRKIAKVYELAK